MRIAQARLDPTESFLTEALHLLDDLLKDAETKARVDSLVEILALRALALFTSATHKAEAFLTLERALRLAEPGGYMRLFIDEGEAMAALLRQAYTRGIVPTLVAALLQAFDEAHVAPSFQPSALIEPLTERELAVFRLLVKGLSNAEIARSLVIATGTVKRHVNSIYGKLGVQSRARAIARSRVTPAIASSFRSNPQNTSFDTGFRVWLSHILRTVAQHPSTTFNVDCHCITAR